MANSRYVQLTPYLLLEIEYKNTVISTAVANFETLSNTNDGSFQFFNENSAVLSTGNVKDRSAFNIVGNRWAHMDIDRGVPYIDSVEDLVLTSVSEQAATVFNVPYDRVRLHMLSGYNLEDIDGFICEISFKEKSRKNVTVSTLTFLKGDTWVNFSANPIIISDRAYDRYIEVNIPSLAELNDEYFANISTPTSTLAYYLSSDGGGYDDNSFIQVNLHEIERTAVENGQLLMWIGSIFNVDISQEDRYNLLTATVRESDDGDYIEFFPTWDGGFIEDYINNLNSIGGDYAVIHNIQVYSRVGFSEIQEDSFTRYQESGFNEPIYYRPIITNADRAFAFSVDYTMRLYDRNGNIQIIRTASLTSLEPRKYGKVIETIKLNNDVFPLKIYNKIYKGASFVLPQITNVSRVETVRVPTFFQMNNIAASAETVIIDADAGVTSEKFLDSGYIFGQGDAIILLSPFDNYVKFRMYRSLGKFQTPEPMDLSHGIDIQLVFIDDNENKRRFSRIRTQKDIRPESGDIMFRIPKQQSGQILSSKNNKFYITVQGEIIEDDSPVDEVTIYTGTFQPYDQIDEVIEKINQIKRDFLLIEARRQRAEDARLKALNDLLNSKSLELDQRQLQLTAFSEELNLTKFRLSEQSIGLDERSKLVAEQSNLLNQRDAEYRALLRESQDMENLTLSQFQQLLADLDARLKSINTNPGGPGSDGGGVVGDGGNNPLVFQDNGLFIDVTGKRDPSSPVLPRDLAPYDPKIPVIIVDNSGRPNVFAPDGGAPTFIGIDILPKKKTLADYINVVDIPGKAGNDLSAYGKFTDVPNDPPPTKKKVVVTAGKGLSDKIADLSTGPEKGEKKKGGGSFKDDPRKGNGGKIGG